MIYIVTEDIDLNSAIEKDIREIYGKDIGISSPQVIVETVKGFVSGFTSFILAIGAISLIVAGRCLGFRQSSIFSTLLPDVPREPFGSVQNIMLDVVFE